MDAMINEMAILIAGLDQDQKEQFFRLVNSLDTVDKRNAYHFDKWMQAGEGEVLKEQISMYQRSIGVLPDVEVLSLRPELDSGIANYEGYIEGTQFYYDVELKQQIKGTDVAFYKYMVEIDQNETDITSAGSIVESMQTKVSNGEGKSLVIPFFEELKDKNCIYDELRASLTIKQILDIPGLASEAIAHMESSTHYKGKHAPIHQFVMDLKEYS